MNKREVVMKRKYIIILISLLCLFNNAFSQENDTLVRIKGYFFFTYNKEVVISNAQHNLEEERANRANKKYVRPYDDKAYYANFVPIQIGNNKCDTNLVIKKINECRMLYLNYIATIFNPQGFNINRNVSQFHIIVC
jgi:hypothetical protein